MTATTYYAHAGEERVELSAADAEFLSREYGVRVTAVTGGDR